MRATTLYIVHYGDNTSEYKTSAWSDAAKFIKHCLDTGVRVRGVRMT